MIIDAMDILYKGNVDCFCLATSDSDFTNLAMRFRNDNLIVIGAGEDKTPQSFRRACDIFISIDKLLKTREQPNNNRKGKAKKIENSSQKVDRIIKIAKSIVQEGADIDGWMHFSAFMNELWRKENDFNPQLYGAQSGKPIPFFKGLTTNGKAVFVLEKSFNIDKIKINK